MTVEKLVSQAEEKITTWFEALGSMLPNLGLAFLILLIFMITASWVESIFRKILRKSMDSVEIINLLLAIIKVLYVLLGAFIALDLIGLKGTVTSLLAGAGIIGLALGFAFQDMAENFIAGVFMGIRKPFKVGHIIQCDDIFGTVKSINLRNTIVENFYGQILIVPNKILFRNTITNYYLTAQRQIEVPVGISYADDPEEAESIILNAINDLDFVIRKDESLVFAEAFESSSVLLKVWFWIDYPGEPGFLIARHKAICVIKRALEENDILIPFPIRTLDFNAKGGNTLSDMDLKMQNHTRSDKSSNDESELTQKDYSNKDAESAEAES